MTAWAMHRLGTLADVRLSSVDKVTHDDELPVLLCNYTDVYRRKHIDQTVPFMPGSASRDEIRRFELHYGDVLITKDSESWMDIGIPSLVSEDLPGVLCGYHLALLRPDTDKIDGRFLTYALQSGTASWEMAVGAVGVTRYGLSYQAIRNVRLPLPRIDEQEAIADFLERETARIDTLIEGTGRLARVLREWEQASLLGVLLDWRRVRTRSLRQYGTEVVTGPFGTQLSAMEYVEEGVPVVNPTHIVRGQIKPERTVTVPEIVATRLKRHRLEVGDIVMGRKGDVGRAAIVDEAATGWLCGSDSIAVRTRRSSLVPEYLALLLSLSLYRQQLVAQSTGATIANVNDSILLSLRIPALAVDQQRKAVDLAQDVVRVYENVADAVQAEIARLQEYRSAIISAAVTGKITVHERVA